MKKSICTILLAATCCACFISCNTAPKDATAISTDTATIAKGEISFNKNCSGCHNFRHDGIGPELAGITTETSVTWLHDFIKDPQQLISSGDSRAGRLAKEYNTTMPSFTALEDEELNSIIAYLHTHKDFDKPIDKADSNAIANPITDTIARSSLVLSLELLTQVPASSDSGKAPMARITQMVPQPGSGNLFVVDLRGKLYRLINNKAEVYMDIAKLKPAFINEPGLATGFGSFAFHPGFEKNGLLYTTHTEPPRSNKADFEYADSIKVELQWVLTEWKAHNPAAPTFAGTHREIMRINMVSSIHGVQEITFNPRSKPGNEDYNLLYIGVGDGGSVENGYPLLVHSKKRIWGTVLRIDPQGNNSANGRYGIPRGNPFVNDPGNETVKEIYAYGFRNPHRITWTSSGKMLVSNIGQKHIESINMIQPGHDYGWPIREGNFVIHPDGDIAKVYPLLPNDADTHITYPVAQYDHDDGVAVSGGYEYRGKSIPQLKGKFLFGDIAGGQLFFIDVAKIKQGSFAPIKEWTIAVQGKPTTLVDLCKNKRVDLHFGIDTNGELYILTKADGKIYKITGVAGS